MSFVANTIFLRVYRRTHDPHSMLFVLTSITHKFMIKNKIKKKKIMMRVTECITC